MDIKYNINQLTIITIVYSANGTCYESTLVLIKTEKKYLIAKNKKYKVRWFFYV